MIAAVRGQLDWVGLDNVVIEVGGVSLRIYIPGRLVNELGEIGSQVKFYTHLYVREDQLTLYGFQNPEQLTIFELLMGVSGVGPRAALNILSYATTEAVQLAIVQNDTDFLKKAPGIGVKTASRIILELKDKFSDVSPAAQKAALAAMAAPGQKNSQTALERLQVIEALTGLGYTQNEVQTALAALPAGATLSVEEMVLAALRYLGQ